MTSGDWRPGSIAFAAIPAASVSADDEPEAAAATAGPAKGTRAATTTADRAEQGTSVTRNDGEDPLAPGRQDPRPVDRRDVAAGRRQERDGRPAREAEPAEQPVGQHGEARQVPGVLERGDEEVEEEHVRDPDRQEAEDPRVQAPQQRRGELRGPARASAPRRRSPARRTSPMRPRGSPRRRRPTTLTRAKVAARTAARIRRPGQGRMLQAARRSAKGRRRGRTSSTSAAQRAASSRRTGSTRSGRSSVAAPRGERAPAATRAPRPLGSRAAAPSAWLVGSSAAAPASARSTAGG